MIKSLRIDSVSDSLDSLVDNPTCNLYNTKCEHCTKCIDCTKCEKCNEDDIEFCEMCEACKKLCDCYEYLMPRYMKNVNFLLYISK